jgi:TRAP-type transport system periplasmic protein
MTISRRKLIGTAAAAGVFMPAIARAEPTVIRWGDVLSESHPQVQMIGRIAREVAEKTSGRIEIRAFPDGKLGSGAEMIKAVYTGALQITTDGPGAIAIFLPELSIMDAPYIWRDHAHLAKLPTTPLFFRISEAMIAVRSLHLLGLAYYGKRHLTTSNKAVNGPADLAGLKVRVPPVDSFRAMIEAWGAEPTSMAFPALYRALGDGEVDGQENPLPTIHDAKFYEVQKFLILTEHVIAPRIVLVNEVFWQSLAKPDRSLIRAAIDSAIAWQDKTLLDQEAGLADKLTKAGMTIIAPDVEAFRRPVLDIVPKKFEEKWGEGMWDMIQAL